jgi:MFS family permease
LTDGSPTPLENAKAVSPSLYHGWRVVAAAFLIALFGWGLGFYGPGIYLVALEERHGWPNAEISYAITTYYLAGATLILFAGGIFERLGARRVVATGAAAMACGIALLTLIRQPWQVYATFAVMSLGWAAMSGAAINIIVAPWFDRRRGLAVSLALNGASAGGVVIAPLIILLMSRFGLGAALWCAAILLLAVVLPTAALVLRPKRAGEHDRADDVSTSQPARSSEEPASMDGPSWRPTTALHDRRVLAIAIPFALGLTAQVGFLTHQVAYLSPLIGTVAAGWAVSLTTSAAIVGRIATGLFVDRVDRRATACANFLLQVVALVTLVSASPGPMLYLGCGMFGLGVGNMISLPGLIVQQEFPRQDFARVVSSVVAVNQFTFAFGPALLGALRQAGGSYTTPLVACLAMQALAALIVVAPRLGAVRSRR